MVGLAMAEVCSAHPTSGGPYYWAAMLSKPQHAAFASWVTGWFNLLGQVAVTTGIRCVRHEYLVLLKNWHLFHILLCSHFHYLWSTSSTILFHMYSEARVYTWRQVHHNSHLCILFYLFFASFLSCLILVHIFAGFPISSYHIVSYHPYLPSSHCIPYIPWFTSHPYRFDFHQSPVVTISTHATYFNNTLISPKLLVGAFHF